MGQSGQHWPRQSFGQAHESGLNVSAAGQEPYGGPLHDPCLGNSVLPGVPGTSSRAFCTDCVNSLVSCGVASCWDN